MKILFLVPYPSKESPSQRFRFEQYFQILLQHGHSFQVQSFLASHNWQLFFKKGHVIGKAQALFKGFMKRFSVLFKTSEYDFIFIHREASPLGPPIFEFMLAKILRRKIIFDFDDAIWLTDRSDESFLLRLLKWRSKVASICRWSDKVSCGNDYLCAFARMHNNNVIFNPTTIDTENVHNPNFYKKTQNEQLIIGWTGSHSTLKYLKQLEPVLREVEIQFPFIKFIFIADQAPDLQLCSSEFIPWNALTEISDLARLDIGIMPLPDDEWSKGKCGFKALQYMALGIPTVASPVGVNTTIIKHGVNGLLASTPNEWTDRLTQLIIEPNLRRQLGKQGRLTVVESYSVLSNSSNFLALFD
jgi:glycosyltransferase involved in cell wall biosynthesis